MLRQTIGRLVATAALLLTFLCSGRAAVYTGGSGANYSMGAMTSDAALQSATITLASAANQSFFRGSAAVPISTITITDAATPGIKNGTPIVVRIPAGFGMTWDETDFSATFGGTAAGRVGGISYAGSNKHLVIAVTSDFAANDTLTISDLSFKNYLFSGSDRLELDFDNDGIADSEDNKTVTILSSFHHGGTGDGYAMAVMNMDVALRKFGTVFVIH